MHLSLSLKNVLAFLALVFVCHELHELSHTTLQYLLCGCWGKRDFIGWKICEACPSTLNTTWITLMGPLLSYSLMLVALFLMSSRKPNWQQVVGWALLFANQPAARILLVLDREGDESVITRNLIQMNTMTLTSWGTEMAIVFLLTIPALIRAWHLLAPKHRFITYIGFLALPILAETLLMNKLANSLLQKGILAGNGILSSALIMNAWNGFWLLILFLTYRSLSTLLTPIKEKYQIQQIA